MGFMQIVGYVCLGFFVLSFVYLFLDFIGLVGEWDWEWHPHTHGSLERAARRKAEAQHDFDAEMKRRGL